MNNHFTSFLGVLGFWGNSKGCVATKHRVGTGEDGSDENEEEDTSTAIKQCQACKQLGHEAFECLRDPNLRTMHDLNEEDKRIEVDEKKNFKRTMVHTTETTNKFLEKIVFFNTKHTREGRVNVQEHGQNAINFDDYNYSNYNEHLLNLDVPELAEIIQ